MEKIWLFGASRKGEISLAQLKERYHILGFIDNDPAKQGGSFLGFPVHALDAVSKCSHHGRIVICSQYVYEIMAQLLAQGIRTFSVFAFDPGPSVSGHGGNVIECEFPADVSVDYDALAILVHNASGSNTYALSKYADLSGTLNVTTVFEYRRCAELFKTRMLSGNFICTHDNVIAKDRHCCQLWHGFPLKGLNYMSRFQTRKHREDHQKYWSRYRSIASYSATYTTLMNACFGGAIEQYVTTGMPRNDFLFRSDGNAVYEQVTGRSRSGRTLAAYLPTFRTTGFGQVNGCENGALFDFRDFDLDVLDRFLESNRITLIVKMHPYETQGSEAAKRMADSDSFCVLTDGMLDHHGVDFYEMLNAVDLLITDYSSVYFDFLLLDRPIIFTPTDAAQYADTRGFLLEPYEFWAPGSKCLTQAMLQKTIEHALAQPNEYSGERCRITDIVHHYRDGESSKRVAAMILECILPTP